MAGHYFEDFRIGEVIELGRRTVSQDEIIRFAREFDPQPFHTDPERARDSAFGGLVASGWHSAALYMRLLVDGFVRGMAHSMGSPGVDKIEWRKPSSGEKKPPKSTSPPVLYSTARMIP